MTDTDGKIFSAKEEPMERFEFEGKTYEAAKPISLALAWADDPCTDIFDLAIQVFGKKHGFTGVIPLTSENFDLFTDVMKEWLVEKGYLKEVEEETYKVGQWFNPKNFSFLVRLSRVSHSQASLVYMSTDGRQYWGEPFECKNFDAIPVHAKRDWLTPIPDPTITETPDKAERRPEKCVHNKNKKCANAKHFHRGKGCGEAINKKYWLSNDCSEYAEIFNLNEEK